MRALFALAALAATSCFGALTVSSTAQITCADEAECPGALVCVSGLCADPSGPCFVQGTADAVGDGTACDDGDGDAKHCVAGRCIAPFCGDGVVSLSDGEECDPGVFGSPSADPTCRADCSQPFCGDGIVDLGESCERDDDDCTACSLTCPTQRADCDSDPTNGCDCPTTLLLEDDFIPFGAAVSDETIWVVRSPADSPAYRLARVPAAGGIVTDIVDVTVGFFGRAPDGALFASLIEGTGPSLRGRIVALEGEALVDVVELAGFRSVFAFDVTEDAFIASGQNDLVRIERDGLARTSLSAGCARAAHLEVCGDIVACAEFAHTQIDVVTLADGAVETLASADVALTFGCSATYGLVWYDGAVVWQRGADGVPVPLASFLTDPNKIASEARLLEDDGELWFSGGLETLQTYRARPDERTLFGVGSGWLFDLHAGRVVLVRTDSTTAAALETFVRAP